jgi:hypothetical protein
MPNLSEISTGTKLILGAGILLVISLFLPWEDFGNEATEALGLDASFNGWRGFFGIMTGIAAIALLAWVVIQVMNVKLNFDLPITEAWLTLGLGVVVFGFALIKLLTIIEEATIWSYIGVLLAALVAVGAWLRAQELGGVSFERTGEGLPRAGDTETTPATDAEAMRPTEPEPMRTTEPETTPPTATDSERPPRSSSSDV